MADDLSIKRPLRIFLCHANDDKPIVRELYHRLIAEGAEVWFDEESLLPGQDWQVETPEAVRKSDVVLVCMTISSVNKAGSIHKEMKLVQDVAEEQPEGAIYLIPVRFEDCEVPRGFGRYHWANLFWNGESFDPDGFQRLMKSLQLRADEVYAELRRKVENDLDQLLGFREEVLAPLFNCMINTESCYLISASGMGKTRVIDFLLRQDIQNQYLKGEIAQPIIVHIDVNTIRDFTEWGFYELIISTLIITLQTSNNKELEKLSEKLSNDFLDRVLNEPLNAAKALHFFKYSIAKILRLNNTFSICLIMDEFDEAYSKLPELVFAQLRGIRDMYKSSLCYVPFLRNLPELLRPINENRWFFELISRNMIGVGPYTYRDTRDMLIQLEKRRDRSMDANVHENIYELSGGHPGLIQAIFSLMLRVDETATHLDAPHWFLKDEAIIDECLRLYKGLSTEEGLCIAKYAQGILADLSPKVMKSLRVKGLLVGIEKQLPYIFSPIFEQYLRDHVKVSEIA